MTSPDSNDDATSSKYNMRIGEGQGIVVGDNTHVVQQFYSTPSEPHMFLTVAETSPHRTSNFYPQNIKPRIYIERVEVLKNIRSKLLNPALPSSHSQQPPLALHGMGGIGKTVLAYALCHDPEIRNVYCDGILWVTLGKPPDDAASHSGLHEQQLIFKMHDWITSLGGTVTGNIPTLLSLQNTLTSLLQDRACLLILDDVWQREDARAFLVGGHNCRVLFTTRDREIAYEIGALVEPIPPMNEAEAITLLEQLADGHLQTTAAKIKKRIIKRLGYLPLAIKLAGAQLRYQSADTWLRTFDIRKLKALRLENYHDSLALTFQLSLSELTHPLRRLYLSLAIFREDDLIPVTVVAHLWQNLERLDEYETAEKLHDLAARALLTLLPHPSLSTRAIQLHDLLHDFICTELGDQIASIHQSLMDVYRRMQQAAGWHSIPDDGYIYDHLAYHLQGAGATKELENLFANPHWMQVRVPQCAYTYDGYLEDLQQAWDHAVAETRQQVETDQEPTCFGDSMRYLLIHTSINSLAANCIPDLLAQAVDEGIWTSQRALSIASRIPDAVQRGKMYLALLNTAGLSKEQREEAQRLGLQTALTLKGTYSTAREEVLTGLAAQLTDRWLKQAWQAVLVLQNEWGGESTLHILASHLREPLLTPAWQAALAVHNEQYRCNALVALAPQLTEPLLAQSWHAVLTMDNKWSQERALDALASQFTEPLLVQALQAALTLHDEKRLVLGLAALAPHLMEPLLAPALQAALALHDEEYRCDALVALAPQLTEPLLAPALQAALSMNNKHYQKLALIALAPGLPPSLLAQTLQVALTFSSEEYRMETLVTLAPLLREPLLAPALLAALALHDEEYRCDALVALAPQLTEPLLVPALQATLALHDAWYVKSALTALVPRLTGSLLAQALQATLALHDEEKFTRVLVVLAPRFTESLLIEAWQAAVALHDEQYRCKALVALAPWLTEPLLTQALQVSLGMNTEEERKEALVALAPRLAEPLLTQAWRTTLDLCNEKYQKEVLIALAPRLTEPLILQAWKTALALHPKWYERVVFAYHMSTTENDGELFRTDALAALAPRLTGSLLNQALQVTLLMEDEGCREAGIIALAPQLAGPLLLQAWQATLALRKEWYRYRTFVALAPKLTEPFLTEALRTALAMNSYCEEALVALAPHLPEYLLAKAWQAALALQKEWAGKEVLAMLAPKLPEHRLAQALQATLAIDHEDYRQRALTALAPRLAGPLLAQALQAKPADGLNQVISLAKLVPHLTDEIRVRVLERALKIIQRQNNEEQQAKALVALAPQLTEPLLGQALEVALTLRYERYQSEALAALVPKLAGPLLTQTLQAALALYDGQYRLSTLVALAPALDSEQRTWVLARVLEEIEESLPTENLTYAELLISIAPHLKEMSLERVLRTTLQLRLETQAKVLVGLAPHLEAQQRFQILLQILQKALATRQEINLSDETLILPPPDDRILEPVLITLASQWTGQLLEPALQAALALYPDRRANALSALAPQLTNRLLEQAIEAALALSAEEGYRTRALIALMPQISIQQRPWVLEQAVQAALTVDDMKKRVDAFIALMPQISIQQRPWVLEQAVQAALAINDREKQADSLAALSPFVVNQRPLLKAIRRAATNYLLTFKQSSRKDMFQGYFINSNLRKLFIPPIFSPETLDAIATHIIVICEDWHWL